MACGKSAVSRELRKRYGFKLVDSDRSISYRQGKTIPQIFTEDGEEAFRNMETRLLQQFHVRGRMVLSTGGGMVLREQNIPLMKCIGPVVWLRLSPEATLERVKRNNHRPLLAGKKTLPEVTAMMEQRRPFYEAAADYIIDTDGLSIQEVARRLVEIVKEKVES